MSSSSKSRPDNSAGSSTKEPFAGPQELIVAIMLFAIICITGSSLIEDSSKHAEPTDTNSLPLQSPDRQNAIFAEYRKQYHLNSQSVSLSQKTLANAYLCWQGSDKVKALVQLCVTENGPQLIRNIKAK